MIHAVKKLVLSYPEDKVKCEHICDTLVYECITDCNHDTKCMRDCWIEHDRCAINCPCNEKCPDGCPASYDGSSCETWFCQGYMPGKVCAAEDDDNRRKCPADGDVGEDKCLQLGCCWVRYQYNDNTTPWCHYHEDGIIDIPRNYA